MGEQRYVQERQGGEWRLRPLFTSQPHFTLWRLGGILVVKPLFTPYLTSLADDD